jgi:hypothetical protein
MGNFQIKMYKKWWRLVKKTWMEGRKTLVARSRGDRLP